MAEKDDRVKQILSSGVTREQLAEALYYAEESVELWRGCAEAREEKLHTLENDAVRMHFENKAMRDLLVRMLRWMPCPTHCRVCERYRYPEGCEFNTEALKIGINAALVIRELGDELNIKATYGEDE